MKPTSRIQDDRLNRISGCELEFPNRWGIPARVFANKEIPLERVEKCLKYALGQELLIRQIY